mmetsp:Transcript_6641/g.8225  ORF Transcript_6641/g.8225 Transcript_6641/m.8225 type:complete len:126 (+) Transcript_6641:446-823(+)
MFLNSSSKETPAEVLYFETAGLVCLLRRPPCTQEVIGCLIFNFIGNMLGKFFIKNINLFKIIFIRFNYFTLSLNVKMFCIKRFESGTRRHRSAAVNHHRQIPEIGRTWFNHQISLSKAMKTNQGI